MVASPTSGHGRARLFAAGAVAIALTLSACNRSSGSHASDTTNDLLNKGLQAHAAGQLDVAQTNYQAVLAADPANQFALYNLGLILQTEGNTVDAEKDYRLALNTNPNFEAALFNLAILRTQSGAVDEAMSLYQRVLTLNPNNAGSHLNLGLLQLQVGQTRGRQRERCSGREVGSDVGVTCPGIGADDRGFGHHSGAGDDLGPRDVALHVGELSVVDPLVAHDQRLTGPVLRGDAATTPPVQPGQTDKSDETEAEETGVGASTDGAVPDRAHRAGPAAPVRQGVRVRRAGA